MADVEFPMSLQVGRATFRLDRALVRAGGVVPSNNGEPVTVRLVPRRRTLMQRLFGFGCYAKCGALELTGYTFFDTAPG